MENLNTSAAVPMDSINSNSRQQYDMIVFCHLRWQFVYQRPQHIISRLAKEMKILMVEEPIGFEPEEINTASVQKVSENLHILQPKVHRIEDIASILPKYVCNSDINLGWFYSPSFVPLLEVFTFNTVVYDCMDELSLFKGAPQHLIDQEKYLLANADIVFTGGKSLYESKSKLHYNVHCFPSSVDELHFAQARNGIAVPEDIAEIKWPIVGYFGVIDERIDLDLIRESARQLPDVSFVMIGPLAKIEELDLPRAQNIHYLGMKSYNELPGYLKAFDIAMMPFALNEATKFISPTKTLEYMAAGKPIISTKIKDVERDYSHCVRLIDDTETFCQGITQIKSEQSERTKHYTEILKNTSWDATVSKMQTLIKKLV